MGQSVFHLFVDFGIRSRGDHASQIAERMDCFQLGLDNGNNKWVEFFLGRRLMEVFFILTSSPAFDQADFKRQPLGSKVLFATGLTSCE